LDRAPEGPQWLADPPIAAIFVDALLHGENIRRSYKLFAWVVMPNHVHVVLQPHEKLPEIMRWIKAATALRANRLAARRGQPFWQREHFDRWIRTGKELASVIAYVEANPVNAGLATSSGAWPWSSASQPTSCDGDCAVGYAPRR
jgi:putative DNA methylase